MLFRIAKTFPDSLAKLTGNGQLVGWVERQSIKYQMAPFQLQTLFGLTPYKYSETQPTASRNGAQLITDD